MTRKLYWALAIIIVGFIALQVYLHIDIINFKEGLEETRIETKTPTTPNGVISEEKHTKETTKPSEEITEPIEVREEPELVSPFGLGPYPKLPDEYPDPETFWVECEDINDELVTRVHIQMKKDGTLDRYSSVGGDFLNGKLVITPLEPGTICFKYATNSKGEQIVVGATGDPDVLGPGTIFRDESEVPSRVKVVTLEEIAIDPYQYLGLQEP